MAFEFLAEAAATMLPEITNTLVEALDYLIASVPEKIGEVDTDGIKSPFMKLFDGLVDLAVKVLPKVWELFKKVFDLLWNDPKTSTYFKAGLLGLFTYVFGPALLTAGGTLLSGLIGFVSSLFTALITAAPVITALGETAAGLIALLGSLLSNPVSWVILGGLITAAFIAAWSTMFVSVGTFLKNGGKDMLVDAIGGPDSLLGGVVSKFSDAFIWSSDMIISGFTNFFGGIFGAVEALFTGDVDSFQDSLIQALWGLGETITGIFSGLGTLIVGAIGSIVVVLGRAIGTLGLAYADMMFEIGSNVTKGIADALGLESVSKAIDGLQSGWEGVKSWWSGGAEEAGDDMNTAAKEAGEKASEGLSGSITAGLDDVTKTADQKLSSVSSMVGGFAEKTADDIAKDAKKINTGLANIESLLKEVDRAKMKSIEGLLDGLGTQFIEAGVQFFNQLDRLLGSYSQVLGKINELDKLNFDVTSISRLGTKINDSITAFSSSIIQTSVSTSRELEDAMHYIMYTMKQMEAIQSIPLTAEKTYANVVQAIVEDVKAVNKSLNELGDIDINATVAKVGAKLGIKDEVIRIERKPIEMNVKFNLTLKADDVAKEIFDAAYKIATTTPGEGTVSPGRGITRAMID